MTDKTLVERLREHRVILKSGDYDGAQLMRAWCDMINAADTIEAQATRFEALEAALRDYMSAFGQALEANGIPFSKQQREADEAARQALESQP